MSAFLFYLLILFFPTQLARHFWPDFSYINGLRIDYLSPTIYVTDILIFFLLVLSLRKILSYLSNVSHLRNLIWLGSLGFLILVSLFAFNPTLSFLKFLKILEFLFLGFYISKNVRFWTRDAQRPSQNDDDGIKLSTIIFLLSVTVFYESVLAIWQFVQQGSIGGPWWFLGERTFNSSTPFIAQAVLNGQLILRPYGTFPHPNVLGGYLAIVLTLINYLTLNTKHKAQKIFLIGTLILGTITLFISFSRTAWIVFGLGVLGLFVLKRKKILTLLILISFIGLVGVFGFWRFQSLLDVDQKSFLIRQQLNNVAVKIIADHPFFGVGLNNFLISLPSYLQKTDVVHFYQPAHNIFLEIAAEAGIIGLIIFIIFIIFIIRRLIINCSYLMLLLVCEILVLGLFDHYLWTLQQGQLLMALVFGLCWAHKNKVKYNHEFKT